MNRIGRTRQALAVAIAATALAVVTLSFAGAAGAAPPNVNLIERADFEIPVASGIARLYPPGSHIGHWHVSGATVGVGPPFAGIVSGIHGRNLQFLSLKDPTASTQVPIGTVCQRVALDPSASYKLRFYSTAVSLDATVIVTWQGHTVGSFDQTGTIGDTDWQLQHISLGRAGATSGEVCFTGAGDGFPIVDAVNLHATTP